MYVNKELTLILRKTQEIIVDTPKGIAMVSPNEDLYAPLKHAWALAKMMNDAQRETIFTTHPFISTLIEQLFSSTQTQGQEIPMPEKETPEEYAEKGLAQLIAFFSEFDFVPNFRFVNSLAWIIAKGKKQEIREFVHNYFALTDSNYTREVSSKMRSAEWDVIIENISKVAPKSVINNRFKIYYGSAGTGKTTLAQSECNGRCVVCNNSMLPADIMEDFVFSNGQPTFQPSALWNCMEKGLPITLDEINLLPFETLRFLQGILDGKKEITYKGKSIHIADGFQVIGTMNLVVNGTVFNLPEPLVDRASEMREFKLTAKQLLSALS